MHGTSVKINSEL